MHPTRRYYERVKIYTKRGDEGQTALASGVRLAKTDRRFEVLGNLDELAAWLGLIASRLDKDGDADRRLLQRAQAACLAAGALVAEAAPAVLQAVRDGATEQDVLDLEKMIDIHSGLLPALTSFILPGGTTAAAESQIARAVARRLERTWLSLPTAPSDDAPWPVWRRYWNRLSDYLFVLGRAINQRAGRKDEVWRGQS